MCQIAGLPSGINIRANQKILKQSFSVEIEINKKSCDLKIQAYGKVIEKILKDKMYFLNI